MDNNLITHEGYLSLVDKLDDLRLQIIEANKDVADGVADQDFREDSKFIVAMEEREKIQKKIDELDNIIESAVVVQIGKSKDRVGFGSTVKVLNQDTEEEKVLTIVGVYETNPKEGKISHASPFGKSLINTRPGEEFEVVTPSGESYWEVLEIC